MSTWTERIDAAEKRGWFTDEDITLAAHWNSCAVGEKLEFQALDEGNAIHLLDQRFDEICEIGFDFGMAVEKHNIPKARDLLAKIQAWQEVA